VGCGYLEHAVDVATDALAAARALSGGDVTLADGCCGLPLLLAGDGPGFARAAESMARSLSNQETVLVADAGCAHALRVRYREANVALVPRVELLVEVAARQLAALGRVDVGDAPVRYHDPCQLGRGLGVYEAPRAVLTRLLGRPPDELERRREHGACSGAGGLLPLTMPEASRAITRERVEEHERAGGGILVTACASSLRAFRAAFPGRVDDLVSYIARGSHG
jgi:Fe-S oxidoreductase